MLIIVVGCVASYFVAFDIASALGTFAILVTTFLGVFWFGNLISPCYSYYKYLLEALTGKCKIMGGNVVSLSKKPVYKDNKNFYYEIDVEVAPERYALFLYDANIGRPEFNEGDRVKFTCYENYILKVNPNDNEED